MLPVLTRLLLLSCAVPFVIGGVSLAWMLTAREGAHPFAHLDRAPQWTNAPVRIDRATQTYERLPSTDLASATGGGIASPTRQIASPDSSLVVGASSEKPDSNEVATLSAVAWCKDRYKSYDATDNTYQPYGGGLRRTCNAPGNIALMATTQTTSVLAGGATENDHRRWCETHYNSYRFEDNSFRSFSGSRKTCLSPFADKAGAPHNLRASM